jgi:hypothetical protein
MVTMRKLLTLVAALALPGSLLFAQAVPAPAAPQLDFSGVLFGNFQWRTDAAAKTQTGGKPLSKFDIGRAYLNFRMQAGDRGSIRITTDIFQQSPSAYYSGWSVRLKYGYFQYDFTKNLAGVTGLGAVGRIGMLHTVVVDHEEGFWPRYLGQTAVEVNGFFSSADVGVASLLTLPNKRGEAYFTITNGTNYNLGETDRFKDFAARLSLTPLANHSDWLRTLTLSPWYYKGWTASQFVLGGGAQVGPVSDGLQRDKRGIFVGLKERRLTGGVEFAQRVEGVEGGANTVALPRTVASRTSNLASVFALVRPMEFGDSKKRSNFGLLGRWDTFKLNKALPASATNPSNTFVVLGAFWDLNARATFALNYQELKSELAAPTFPAKTLFLHWQATF